MAFFRSTNGRVTLHSQRGGRDSGGLFLEVRDGVIFFGWYDSFLKKEVFVKTSSRVIFPGYWHYIYVRKSFPQRNGWTGTFSSGSPYNGLSNWYNSIYEYTDGRTFDSIVCRRFKTGATVPFEDGLWVKGGNNAAISFTVDDDITLPTGTVASGLVSKPNTLYTSDISDLIDADTGSPFHDDMEDMYFQWDSAVAAFGTKLFRIISVVSGSRIQVVDISTGAAPGWGAGTITARAGGVFTGVSLVKSDDFDASKNPDRASYDPQFFGSSEALDPRSGIGRFDGKFDSLAYGVVRTTTGVDVQIFRSSVAALDDIEIGVDSLSPERLDNPGGGGSTVGPLNADGTRFFASFHTS